MTLGVVSYLPLWYIHKSFLDASETRAPGGRQSLHIALPVPDLTFPAVLQVWHACHL